MSSRDTPQLITDTFLEAVAKINISHLHLVRKPVADLRGARPMPPPDRIFFNFMQFLGNFNIIVSWYPPEGLLPLLGEILDRLLETIDWGEWQKIPNHS